MRTAWLLLVLGCATAPATPPEAALLERLEAKSNAYASFHLRAELTDGRQTVPIEMAWRAPDRALLRYGQHHLVIFSGGVGHFILRRTVARFDAGAAIAKLRERYGDPPIGPGPEPVFGLGDWDALLAQRGLRATLGYGRLGARLGWLEELRAYRAEGLLFRRGAAELELREDGFIGRAQAGASRFTVQELSIDRPVADSVFALPVLDGFQDGTAAAQAPLERALEDSYRQWVVQASSGDAGLEALVRVDLARRYDPKKMTEVLRASLADSLEAWRRLSPAAQPEAFKAKLLMDRGKAMGSIEIMEAEIQREFEKDLDRIFRGMPALPSVPRMESIARRWSDAVSRQIDAQIRKPFQGVFDEVSKDRN